MRVTHLPTGLVVTCQDEKSQHKNKAKALKILRARLLERARRSSSAEIAANRKAMVGTGDRSEKIRTYNFPQSRITDHRVNVTLHQLDRVLDGDLDPIVDALVTKAAGTRRWRSRREARRAGCRSDHGRAGAGEQRGAARGGGCARAGGRRAGAAGTRRSRPAAPG